VLINGGKLCNIFGLCYKRSSEFTSASISGYFDSQAPKGGIDERKYVKCRATEMKTASLEIENLRIVAADELG